MWSSQKVVANHKTVALRTVNHRRAICSQGLNVPDALCEAASGSSFYSLPVLERLSCQRNPCSVSPASV